MVVLFVVFLLVIGGNVCLVVWRGVRVVVCCVRDGDETVFLLWLSLSENISFWRS